MGIFFGSLVIVPGLLVLNGWVIPVRWGRRRCVFLAGVMLPVVIGVIEYFWLHGPSRTRSAINSAFVAPFVWIWLFTALTTNGDFGRRGLPAIGPIRSFSMDNFFLDLNPCMCETALFWWGRCKCPPYH